MKAGVIGHPIAHSKSPIIHEYWMTQHNVQGSYERLDIAPDDLEKNMCQLIDQGYDGFNVTLPHKQNIMTLCDKIDNHARAIGAVNTVVIKDGKLLGRNTDAFGFIKNIKTAHPNFDFQNKRVLVLGAGGAARAVIYGLLQEGVGQIFIANRTRKSAEALQVLGENFITVMDWDDSAKLLESIDIIVNTTALGMIGKPSLDMDLVGLKQGALVSDIVYTPLMTPLLMQATKHGHEVVTGIGMLLHQARPAFEAWTGIMPEVDAHLEALMLS